MADIIIADPVDGSFNQQSQSGIVWRSKTVGYAFVNESARLGYYKTDDGGSNWGSRIALDDTLAWRRYVLWYDRWTSGDTTGTLVHIFFSQTGVEASYASFNTLNDTLSSVVTVDSAVNSAGDPDFCISIAKARGGNLGAVGWHNGLAGADGDDRGFWRSTDGGDTWTKRADPTEGNAREDIILLPGNESDNQDFWLLYNDESAQQVSLKVYDDSADSWSETAITGAGDVGATNANMSVSGVIRHSDGHLFVAVKTDPTANDLRSWEINGAASITERGVVIAVEASLIHLGMMIDQGADRLYVVYVNTQANHDVRYHTSTDGAVTWSAATRFNATAADLSQATPVNITHSVGTQGGRFMPTWIDSSDGSRKLESNADNSVEIPGTDGTAGPSPPELRIPQGEGGIGPSPPELVLSGAAFTATNVIGSEESTINFIHAGINDTQGPLEIRDEANEVVISSG